jgi:hypothetical protein
MLVQPWSVEFARERGKMMKGKPGCGVVTPLVSPPRGAAARRTADLSLVIP